MAALGTNSKDRCRYWKGWKVKKSTITVRAMSRARGGQRAGFLQLVGALGPCSHEIRTNKNLFSASRFC